MTFSDSYIALCRELRLKREMEPGDWGAEYGEVFAEGARLFVEMHRPPGSKLVILPYDRPAFTSIWLPRLDQWLEMLEEAGESVTLVHAPAWGRSAQIVRLSPIWCTSYEESCARLWLAITGRPVRV
jgi:hypothetical protein